MALFVLGGEGWWNRSSKCVSGGSNPGREVVGGLTTFLAMAYIVAVNPAILVEAGMPFQAALTSTCFGAALAFLVMFIVR